VVSPYSTGGRVVHSYTDHVSILKFIERNLSGSRGRLGLSPTPLLKISDLRFEGSQPLVRLCRRVETSVRE
jgi:hypothetical protein